MNGSKLFGLCVALALGASPARAVEWKVIRHQNRDYVSFQNVADFYRFGDYSDANRTISLRGEHRGIRARVGASEIYINGVRFFTYHPLVENSSGQLVSAFDVGKLLEPILRPSRIREAQPIETVVLDPGHGGTDQGTANSWGSEKAFALDVALHARAELLRAGFKVEMTRETDTGLSLDERVDFANRFSDAVFVSIHFNSASGGAGIESFALAPEGISSSASEGEDYASDPETRAIAGNAQDGLNIALTAAVHAAVISRVAAYDRGVRPARFKVLRNIRVPALLLEAGFLNNPAEARRIASAEYRQQLGVAIAQGIQNYNTAVNYRSSESSFAVVRTLPPHTKSITEPLHVDEAVANNSPPETPAVSLHGRAP